MKKLLFTLIALLLSGWMMAGSFVKINYSTRAELEQLFADPNLTVHHFTNSTVYATAKVFDAKTMVMIDENAFQDCEVYTLLYDPNPVIFKGAAMPFKNDGAVAIFNKEARLAPLTCDFPVVTAVDPRIREMMDQVSMDSLEATVQHLQDYQSRMWNSDNAFAASDWIAGRMAALGLEVEQQPFYASTWTGSGQAAPNVIGIQRGTLYPDTYVVCGSHFDSFSYEAMYGSGTCPGADDNATGVASVLESARILTQYEFEYSIVYCAYGCEEMGLYGSEAYASRCQQEGMDIIGYFNNDMNGYLYGDVIHIDCIYPNSVAPIGDYYMNVANVYFPEMPVQHVNFTSGDSDHTSFNNHGYMGIYPFEDYQNYSPYIHTPNDVIGTSVTSFAMSQRYCQMNIGCLTEIANPVGETPVVFCNPVVGFEIPPIYFKEMGVVDLLWDAPEEGSTGELQRFDVYRNDTLIASVDYDPSMIHYSYWDESIPVGTQAAYYIMSVYSDGCEAPSETLTGEGAPTSTQDIDSNNVQIYPNPVENQLTVKAKGLQRVIVYNVMGQQVATIEVKQDESTIEMGKYPKGLYTLQLVTENGIVNQNVVVK
ncbi:MAG: M28 family peptidase [Bacteroidales bacterium]|nr:M28 family peptidase [Bacteroidales bacterium]MBR6846907.1 M28 family peptidase [Bacteroidales bacterium]